MMTFVKKSNQISNDHHGIKKRSFIIGIVEIKHICCIACTHLACIITTTQAHGKI